MKEEIITGSVGTVLGVVGTATQTNELLQTISLIITIIGALITYIFMPLIMWYIKAKSDGKITKEEIEKGKNTLKEGIEKISKTNPKKED